MQQDSSEVHTVSRDSSVDHRRPRYEVTVPELRAPTTAPLRDIDSDEDSNLSGFETDSAIIDDPYATETTAYVDSNTPAGGPNATGIRQEATFGPDIDGSGYDGTADVGSSNLENEIIVSPTRTARQTETSPTIPTDTVMLKATIEEADDTSNDDVATSSHHHFSSVTVNHNSRRVNTSELSSSSPSLSYSSSSSSQVLIVPNENNTPPQPNETSDSNNYPTITSRSRSGSDQVMPAAALTPYTESYEIQTPDRHPEPRVEPLPTPVSPNSK